MTMVLTRPFNRCPLQVKLFTVDAEKAWKLAAQNLNTSLPPGLTCSVELEGVDGNSGHFGSGRQGPINVKDGRARYICIYLIELTDISQRHLLPHFLQKIQPW